MRRTDLLNPCYAAAGVLPGTCQISILNLWAQGKVLMEYRGFRYEIAKVVGDRTYDTLRTKRVIDALCPAELRSGKIR
jgi:hypothetical protein